ncbi:MAG: prolipoprotein diacylglyceryl transferase [Lachnospiraceae bacterium]|nr:prolipoprotein diacylglyceryl transferase [Lachnospiraceae bacterium]
MQLLKESIEFPNLFSGDIEISRVAFTLFGIDIYWYGILIAIGVVLAFSYAMKMSKEFGLIADNVFDTAFIAVILGFIGARAYYCIFYNIMHPESENKYNIITMFTKIHDGGLAIYGGVIAGVVTALIICRIKKSPLLPLLDIAAPAFLIGQAIGRWGNFINQECYGAPTAGKLPWGMTGTTIVLDPVVIEAQRSNTEPVLVHPCFLYESLWCVAGLLLIHFAGRRTRKFDGEVFLYYVLWYGAGRAWIESLRTDSLYAGSLKVSQVIAISSAILALIMIVYFRISAAKNEKLLYADTELSKEKLEEFEKKRVLEKENAAAKKAMKEAEKIQNAAKAPSILGEESEQDDNNDSEND